MCTTKYANANANANAAAANNSTSAKNPMSCANTGVAIALINHGGRCTAAAPSLLCHSPKESAFASPTSTRAAYKSYAALSAGVVSVECAEVTIAIASVALILFQGPKGDGVVNSLNERRVFGSAAETKSAVDYVTAGLIGSFIVLSAVLAATQ